MRKVLKVILTIAAVILIPIYLYYAIDFGLQLMEIVETVEQEGLREAVSPKGGSDMQFYADVTWLGLMILSILIIPLILLLSAIIYFSRRKRKKHHYK